MVYPHKQLQTYRKKSNFYLSEPVRILLNVLSPTSTKGESSRLEFAFCLLKFIQGGHISPAVHQEVTMETPTPWYNVQ